MHAGVDGLMICCPLSLLPQLKATSEVPMEQNLAAIGDIEMSKELVELRPTDQECQQLDQKVRQMLSTRQKLLAVNESFNIGEHEAGRLFAASGPETPIRSGEAVLQ